MHHELAQPGECAHRFHEVPGAARGNASYSSSYFSDDVLLAALYEGNALDCALYAAAAERLGSDLAKLRPRAAPVSAYSARCRRGAAALRRLRGY